jgi:hypothetical protein
MFAGDHDLWHPTFISRCVSILEADPMTVLAYSRTMLIDLDGHPLELMPDQIDTRNMPSLQRYKHIIWTLHACNMVYGVIRRDALIQTIDLRPVWGSDFFLLAKLSLKGTFAQIPEPLFYRRKNRSNQSIESHKKRLFHALDPETAYLREKMPLEILWRETRNLHLRVILNAPFSLLTKLHAIITTLICFRVRFRVGTRASLILENIAKRIIPYRFRPYIKTLLYR